MKGNPELIPRALAAPGSIPHAVLSGEGGDLLSLAAGRASTPPPAPAPARLGPESFGLSGPGVRPRLEAVLRGEGYFVTTGHQPVLLLGPLYILYKALTAISLAGWFERRLGVPVVPLFWIASDDHDWDEVGRATLLDRSDELRTLLLPAPPGGERRSVGPHRLDGPDLAAAGIGTADFDDGESMTQTLGSSEFSDHYLELIRDAYVEDRTVSDAFAQLLAGVLGDRGYAWLDAAHSDVRRAASPLYSRLLEGWDVVLKAESDGAARLSSSGFEVPIAPVAGALPLFHDAGRGRRRVVREGGGTAEIWRRRLDASPEHFSPNVASRPVLESFLLPVRATVLGPGEIAYWTQLGPLFEALGVRQPEVHPRAAWTLIEARIGRILGRMGLSPEDLALGADPVAVRLTREARPEAVDGALNRLRHDVESGMSEVEGAVAELMPGLRGAAGRMRKGILNAVAQMSRQIDRSTRETLDLRLGQLRRAETNLFPGRRPQERVLNAFPLLCRYGPGLVQHLAAATDERVASFLAAPDADG